ncbi:MAG: ABC transporter ATP-binding protein [Oligoflexia bacterium]|nr:ABC transporter ATP-binding protein [Oligoflexia bacterium]
MIEVNALGKKYGDYIAVENVTFSAAKGDIIGFLGPNGAGKTTTIRMLVTYLAPSAGSANIAGFNVVTQADQVRRRIGYLPETPPLYGEMTIREYLTFVARIKGIPAGQIKSRVEMALEKCFITDVAGRLCQHLSRGYRQRAGLAQAIIHDPDVIVLDEPTSGLDPKQIIEIRNLIKSLSQHHTVLLSTHILPEVSMVCNKVVIVNRGRTVFENYLKDIQGRSLEQLFMECVGKEHPLTEQV